MKIIDKLNQKGIHISFEVFPPKTEAGFDKVLSATDEIAKLNPSYISVTYGAGGGTSKNTATFPDGDRFHYAYELVQEIKKHGDFCIGAACYPEGHVEQEHKEDDIRYLKQKVDSGVDFLTTQMFFDNDIHYNFLYRIREAGITVPVLPGIMPITSAAQMKRSQELSGTVFPRRFLAILDRFGSSPEAMKQAGIAYATDQIIDLLANGVNNIHIYSMNKPEIAIAIMNNLSEIIKC